jgi:hypothetical protein
MLTQYDADERSCGPVLFAVVGIMASSGWRNSFSPPSSSDKAKATLKRCLQSM